VRRARALLQELQRHEWNLSGVARELDISRNTLYRKLQRLNIEPPDKSLASLTMRDRYTPPPSPCTG
jgi:DNA-binding NtrC family response regulator